VRPEEKTTVEDTKELIAFKLGGEEFGADVMQVREISKPIDITRVPRAPPFVDGVINLRGRITSIVNLRKKFGFEPKEPGPNTRIVIAELDGHPIGLVVDEVTDVLKVPVKNIDPTPELVTSEASKEYLKGVGKVGEKRLIILLDLEKMLSREEFVDIRKTEERATKPPKVEKEVPEEVVEKKAKVRSRNKGGKAG
jgi:purine-binding chemotaxis protein CheW